MQEFFNDIENFETLIEVVEETEQKLECIMEFTGFVDLMSVDPDLLDSEPDLEEAVDYEEEFIDDVAFLPELELIF